MRHPPGPDDPTEVGRFRIVGALGSGGMGRVLLGEDPSSGRLAAIKLVHTDLIGDDGFRARFRREVRLAAQAPPGWTAPFLDADPDAPRPWLATAYLDAPSLLEYLEDAGPMDPSGAARLGAGLGAALSALHGTGLVHRDLKPSNVLLTDGGPRLIDFGISRAVDGTSLTGSGQAVGTPEYMSSEQVLGAEIGPASDVFALGSLLTFVTSLRTPFAAGSPAGVLYRVVHSEPDLPAALGPLEPVVRACLAKDPAARPSAPQVRDRLAAFGFGGPHGTLHDEDRPGAGGTLPASGPSTPDGNRVGGTLVDDDAGPAGAQAGGDARPDAGGPESRPATTADAHANRGPDDTVRSPAATGSGAGATASGAGAIAPLPGRAADHEGRPGEPPNGPEWQSRPARSAGLPPEAAGPPGPGPADTRYAWGGPGGGIDTAGRPGPSGGPGAAGYEPGRASGGARAAPPPIPPTRVYPDPPREEPRYTGAAGSRRRALIVACAVVVAALLGVGGTLGVLALRPDTGAATGSGPATTAPPATSGVAGASTPTPSTAPGDLLTGATVVDTSNDVRYGDATDGLRFASPSGNIACTMGPFEVRCDVTERTWKVPPRPATCPLAYGTGVQLEGATPAALTCAGDTVADPSLPALKYGTALRGREVACVSRQDGVECRNTTTNHGFVVSRTAYRLY